MCSIAGFISSTPLDRNSAMRLCSALLHYGAERGDQSAGIYVNGRVLKRATHPSDFIASSDFHNAFEAAPSLALVHTRWPTSGARGDAQAQPFKVGATIGVHNGMYFESKELKDQWGLVKKSGVDSELATSFVESYGIKLLPEFLASGYGCSALAFAQPHATAGREHLYLIRDGNPLAYMTLSFEDDTSILVFASTAAILRAAIGHVWLIPLDAKVLTIQEMHLVEALPRGVVSVVGAAQAQPRTNYNGDTDWNAPDVLVEARLAALRRPGQSTEPNEYLAGYVNGLQWPRLPKNERGHDEKSHRSRRAERRTRTRRENQRGNG